MSLGRAFAPTAALASSSPLAAASIAWLVPLAPTNLRLELRCACRALMAKFSLALPLHFASHVLRAVTQPFSADWNAMLARVEPTRTKKAVVHAWNARRVIDPLRLLNRAHVPYARLASLTLRSELWNAAFVSWASSVMVPASHLA